MAARFLYDQAIEDAEAIQPDVTGINYPNLGRPLYPQVMQPRVAEWISSPNRPSIPQTGIMRNIWEGTKNLASNFSPTGIINALTFRKGADQSFGGYPDGTFSRAGLFPQEVQNLEALADQGLLRSGAQDAFGTNVVSQFGDYNQHMADKKAQFEAKLQDKDYLSRFENPDEINTLEDLYKAYQTKYGPNSAIARRLNHYANFGGATDASVADKITTGAPEWISGRTEPIAPVTTGGGGTFDPRFDQRGRRDPGSKPYGQATWRGATAAREKTFADTGGTQGQVAGPGFGKGAYWAEGGRVGLKMGGDPTQWMETQETISPFQIQQEEGVPMGLMASNPDPMAELNEFSLLIFKKPFDQLNDSERDILFEMMNDQSFGPEPRPVGDPYGTPQGEEIVEEGIARLV